MTISRDIAAFKTSINNKNSFMKQVFIDPYFEGTESARILANIGVDNTKSMNEGILRINYNLPTVPSAPVGEADMQTIFNNANLTKLDHTVLSSLNESSYIPAKGFTIYEYTGTLYTPMSNTYIFTANTSGQLEVYINYAKHISVYGAANPVTPVSSPPISLDMGEVPIKMRFFQLGGSGVSQSLHLQWRKSSDPVASNETLGCRHLFYDSSLLNRTIPQNASFNKDAYIDNLLDYSAFKNYFGVQSSALTTALTTPGNYNTIRVAVDSSNYEPFVCSGASYPIPTGDFTNDGKINGDINYYEYLNTTLAAINNGNEIRTLLEEIGAGRVLYNAMDDVVYEKRKNNDAANPLPEYRIDPTTKRPMTAEANTVLTSDFLTLLETVTPVERFVLRRLILLTDLVAHSHIAMFLFESIYNSTTPFACQSKLADMLGHFITRIKNLNRRYDRIFESGTQSENEILSNLYESIHTFNRNTATMGKLTTDFKDSKTSLKANLRLMESEKNLYGSGNKWTLGFMIVTVVVIATLVAYSILSQTMPEYKWIGAATVSATAFLTVLVIYLIKSKKMETFADVYNPSSWRDAIASSRAIDIIRDAYQYDLMREIHAYIQNTIHMALILQNSKTYGYINHTMQKEINYYTASKQQVDNAKTLAKASTRMYNLETRNNLSRVNVYIALIIILTFAIVGYRLSGDSVALRYTVLIIASVLLLIVALLYIIDVERKVRTDGRKIYWGQPNDLLNKL
jgi:hypothetical protein